ITSNAVIPTNLMPCSSGVNGSMPFAAVISSQTGLLMASSYTLLDTSLTLNNTSFRSFAGLDIGCNNEIYLTGSFDYRAFNGWTNDSSGFLAISIFSHDLSSVIASTRFGYDQPY